MLNRIHVSLIFFILAFSTSAFCTDRYTIKSPDTRISVAVWLTPHGEPSYSIVHSGSTVLRQSKLGIIRGDGDFSSNLLLDSVSDVQSVTDKYSVLHGKRLVCSYFIDGYPGKYVVLARKTGGVWYIAGINGEHSPHTITFDLPLSVLQQRE